MKILFTIQEEKARGINFMLKSLMIAAHADGHNVGLLVGYPPRKGKSHNQRLTDKFEHVDLQRYIQDGTDSFRHLVKGGLRKRHIMQSLLNLRVFKASQLKLSKSYLLGETSLEQHLDYIIKSPY